MPNLFDAEVRAQALVKASKVCIFDFDGVIADTEPLHLKSYSHIMINYGVRFGAEQFRQYIGRPEPEIHRALEKDFGITMDTPSAMRRRLELFLESIGREGLRPFPAVVKLLYLVESGGQSRMILSSQRPEIIHELLGKWGLSDRFAAVHTVYDSNVSKIDLLIDIVRGLPYSHDATTLVEDSPEMICHARSLGMRTIRIVHSLSTTDPIEADVTLDFRGAQR